MDARPIGVFDSGLGGLTVVKELEALLPGEDIVYFGDTGRVPYGTRSFETIERYARQDMSFLLEMDVKLMIAACGTVSSVAPHVGNDIDIPFIGVVEPAARKAVEATQNGRVGVIGTTATIQSGAFDSAIHSLASGVSVFQQDCPMFVHLVENGWCTADDPIARLAAERYLGGLKDQEVDTLILGCTHFPILRQVIAQVMGPDVTLINTGAEAARRAATLLKESGQCAPADKNRGRCRFFVSDAVGGFNRTASMFLGRDIREQVSRVDIINHPILPSCSSAKGE
ncbi:glutamate racemase [Solibaculum mannosilyticum]|uniref:glutamate racemase n=1 Tax=Solibaculum mannosilyticum TaxID=2780922 RepID=UPI0034AC93A0